MAKKNSDALRQHLLDLLRGGQAHADFEAAVADFPSQLRGKKPKGAPHTAWQLLEHLRIAQWDILEFSRNAKHVSPKWPDGYWPKTEAPPSASAWNNSVRSFRADLKAMAKLVASEESDLSARIPHGDGQTLMREALLVADHNAYHIGQLILLRRLLGAWKD
ncbi:MAG TPA: DinB family protein [Bryobacteraceae bacterium]|nr:DinB family protein [Bryobacteraceae bacterium]